MYGTEIVSFIKTKGNVFHTIEIRTIEIRVKSREQKKKNLKNKKRSS